MNPHFASLIIGLATQANNALDGKLPPAPEGSEAPEPRQVAQALIETLAAIEEKTRGNLAAGEKQLLDEALTSLRIKFATGTTQ
jgi:hypothetical protein